MKLNLALATAGNSLAISPLTFLATMPPTIPDRRSRAHRPQPRQRFKIVPFTNAGGSQAWRVSGIKRTGERIRENFNDANSARCRQTELEAEYLARTGEETALRSTRLSETQARIAEAVFPLLDRDDDLLAAVNFWRQHRHQHAEVESPRIDDAIDQYVAWLNIAPFRDATKRHWRTRMNVFKNGVQNIHVSDVTPEMLENFLATRHTSPGGKDTDRRAISRFFSWCIERPRRWVVTNPAREVRIDRGEIPPPEVLTVEDCEKLFRATENYKAGLLVPYVAVCLIAGLRPDEAKRLAWPQVNLSDKEIRLESNQTKTKTARVVAIHPTLARWLKPHQGRPFYPVNWRKEFDAVKAAAGFTGRKNPDGTDTGKPFPHDVMRHTAISHFFRDCGSYGLTAEQFGNSEAIIKKHYQGRVSSADTKKFYSIKPQSKVTQ
jgi:integrase